MANEGLGWDSLLKMFHNPGGDCYWVGGRPKVYYTNFHQKLNGTESQRIPDQVSCDRAIRYSGLGVRSVGPVGDLLEN